MKQVYSAGSLGDVYTIGLKLMKRDDEFEIFHHTNLKFWYNEIREIYSIFDNIKRVNFVEFATPESEEISGIPEDGMIWFPELDLEYVSICEYPYVVICPHAGREDMMARKIPIDTVYKMIELLQPLKVILLGTDKRYRHIRNCENLIGETNIKEATSMIIDSAGFCGPEGYPAFVALSHKKPSVIFWVRYQPVEARLLGNPWQEYILDLIHMKGGV
jgi:ADP-heptose:LPS heptosyltransferase